MWRITSTNFAIVANNSKCVIYSFQNGELGVRLQSIWATIEYQLLQTKDIIYGVVSKDGTIQIIP